MRDEPGILPIYRERPVHSASRSEAPPSAQLRSGAQSLTQALRVNALEEVPYAIGLIRQSLDRQLDDAPEAP